MSRPSPDTGEEYRVTTLELFFDLVFVFVITQFTGVLVDELSAVGLLRVVLMFVVLWWMYSGYAWLTNTRSPTTPGHRLLLILGMGGFLLIALATPHAFDDGGVWWGLGYLLVVLVHGGLYLQFTPKFIRVLPANLLAAGCVIATGFVDGVPVYALWALAVIIPIAMPYVVPPAGRFVIQPAHIVERHGLMVIITLGETIVAIGIGLADVEVDLELVQAALLGLALVAALWWTYFAGDDERASAALTAAEPDQRPRMTMFAYFYAHIPIVVGVIAMAAGIKKALGHIFDPLPIGASVTLAGGLALYLVGDAWFRHVLRIGPSLVRLATAALGLATIPLGAVMAEVQVVTLLALLVGALVLEHRASAPTWDLGQSRT